MSAGRRGRTLVAVAIAAAACILALGRADAAFGPQGQDQRISFAGPEEDPLWVAQSPDVAYNPTADEYLVVWETDDNSSFYPRPMRPMSPPPASQGEIEIFAQRLSGTGAPIGSLIRVSEQGRDGDANVDAVDPSVAYNAAGNDYLIVWTGDDGFSGENEIWGQRLSATGAEVGGSDFQISHMGPDGTASFYAFVPAVTANPSNNEYFVVWEGDDNTPPLVDDEREIFGQRIAGNTLQGSRIRVSAQGADGNTASRASDPSVAYVGGEYLVAWTGNVGTTQEYEIWGRRVSAAGELLGGSDDIQISNLGPSGSADYDAELPDVAANPNDNEFLVVWTGDDDTGPLVDNEFEVFGQRVTAGTGSQPGTNDFRISEQGADGDTHSTTTDPSVAYDAAAGDYVVTWTGSVGATTEFEIWARRLSAIGERLGGSDDLQVSHMGTPGLVDYDAFASSVVTNPSAGEALVVWQGDDFDDEFEIHAHKLGLPTPALTATNPPGFGNENNPKLIGTADPAATVDVFRNAGCAGVPAVNDAPAAALNAGAIVVAVADNSFNQFSVTASSDGRTSRCSNSISYTELSPPQPPAPPSPQPPPPGVDAPPVVSGFVVSPKRVRVGGRTTFRFRLSERATARIVVERLAPKKRAKRAAALMFTNRPAGQNRIVFRARRLSRGTYRVTIVATDAARQRSTPRRAPFAIVRRRP